MRRVTKIGLNQSCPCGEIGRKYKQCCRGKVDWEALLGQRPSEVPHYLSTRGKNRLFMNLVFDALQIDTDERVIDVPDFKRAFTSQAVRKIFEAVQFVWPDGEDLKRVLQREAKYTSGLYVGHYEPELVVRGITRHSLYAERILLVDPLMYPAKVRDEYSPLLHPEMHRTSTLKWITMWVRLLPWINEGIVGFVRAPGDFYPELALASMESAEARFKNHPELRTLRDQTVADERSEEHYDLFLEQTALLALSDEYLRERVKEHDPTATETQIEQVVAHVRRRRDDHPYFLGPERPGEPYSELLQLSTGTNYDQAKLIALHSGSYVMTDLSYRWREIELDRAASGIDGDAWSPFAKAFQRLRFNFLDGVPLKAALTLRREGRLESVRNFLRKAWTATTKDGGFDDANAPTLAAELEERINEADAEWRKIDTDLVKIVTVEAAAGLFGGAQLIAAGQVAWLAAAAAAVVGAGTLTHSTLKRAAYKVKYPGGFFVDLRKGRFGNGAE